MTLGGTPAGLVADTVGRVEPTIFNERVADHAMQNAVAALSESQSTWRPAQISREIAAALPTTLGLDAHHEVAALVEELRARVENEMLIDLSPPALSGVARRRDGRPITEAATGRALTTTAVLDQETRITDQAQARLDASGEAAQSLSGVGDADDLARTDGQAESAAQAAGQMVLSGPQREAAAAVSGTRQLVLVVGPAGTGKTTALRPAVAELRADGRSVFGVAPSATAAEVLALDTSVETDTLDKLLVEHRDGRCPDWRYDLPVGATVLVDEAAMVSTANLAELFTVADIHQWRLALVGDPFQFAAVGRSGMFGHLVDRFGSIELDQVHRFGEPWERHASLQLRRRDPTVAAIDKGDYRLFVGDEIATRHNERAVTTDRGHMVKNRDHWRIDAVHPDGGLTVSGRTGQVRLEPDYVTEHVELAYAETSHAKQGRIVDRSYLYLDAGTDTRGVYVPLTRGRLTNEAFVALNGNNSAADVITEAVTRTWIDRPALEVQAELNPPTSEVISHDGGEGPQRAPAEESAVDQRRRVALARARRARGTKSPIGVTDAAQTRQPQQVRVREL